MNNPSNFEIAGKPVLSYFKDIQNDFIDGFHDFPKQILSSRSIGGEDPLIETFNPSIRDSQESKIIN